MENLDVTDIMILRELQKDAKLTTKELAAKVHLSPSPVFERLKRLERDGYIKNYIAVVDPIKAGNGIMVLCNVRLKHHSNELSRQFTSVIAGIDEVVECFNTSGDYDYQLKIYARSMAHYQELVLGRLGELDCIGRQPAQYFRDWRSEKFPQHPSRPREMIGLMPYVSDIRIKISGCSVFVLSD